jgi:hypothetical protein
MTECNQGSGILNAKAPHDPSRRRFAARVAALAMGASARWAINVDKASGLR